MKKKTLTTTATDASPTSRCVYKKCRKRIRPGQVHVRISYGESKCYKPSRFCSLECLNNHQTPEPLPEGFRGLRTSRVHMSAQTGDG